MTKLCHYEAAANGILRDLRADDGALNSLAEALARWRRGDVREALHQLEHALGTDFHGLGDITPEQLK